MKKAPPIGRVEATGSRTAQSERVSKKDNRSPLRGVRSSTHKQPISSLTQQKFLKNAKFTKLTIDQNLALSFFDPSVSAIEDVSAADLEKPLSELIGRFFERDEPRAVQLVFPADGTSPLDRAADPEAPAYAMIVLNHGVRISADASSVDGVVLQTGHQGGDLSALRQLFHCMAEELDATGFCEIGIDFAPHGRGILSLAANDFEMGGVSPSASMLSIPDATDRNPVAVVLEEAKREAELDLAGSRLLAGLTHNLRQPLQAISLAQGVLGDKATDPNVARLVTRIGEAVDVISGLLDKPGDMRLFDAERIKPAPGNFQITQLFARLEEAAGDQPPLDLLQCRVLSSGLSVRSDPIVLEHIVRTLIAHAVKHSSRDGISLRCRRRGDVFRTEIWGGGISEDQMEVISEDFPGTHDAGLRPSRESWPELVLMQRVANLLGHTIEVGQHPEKEPIFALEFQYYFIDTPDRVRGDGPRRTVADNGDTILLVETDPVLREGLQSLFLGEGYQILAVAEGRTALELIAGGTRPDVLISDYSLPSDLTGFDVARCLREICSEQLPVIILTEHPSARHAHAITDMRYLELTKPLEPKQLLSLVRAQLADREQKTLPSSRPADATPREHEQTVYLVEDDDLLRDAIRDVLEIEGRLVVAFDSGEAFLDAYRPDYSGCLLVDARLPGLSGIELLQWLKAERYHLPSIVLTGYGEVSMAVAAMKTGAIDFIEKPIAGGKLLASVDRALELAQNLSVMSSRRLAAAASIARLTPRERQVMDSVIAGHPNKIIAADMKVSQRTVENHRAAVMRKTRSKSLSDLIRVAINAAREA